MKKEPTHTIPSNVERHLEAVAEETGISPKDSAIEFVRNNWIEKEQLFCEQTDAISMIQVDHFPAEDPRGALLLTYSASLLVLGPRDPSSGTRSFEYASIKTRTDVPELLTGEAVQISADVRIDQPVSFSGVALQRSSEILHIATFPEATSIAEQAERLRQAAIFLTNGFVHANRTLTGEPGDQPDQFDIRSIVRYIADRNGTTQTLARGIIDDYLSTVETGALLGRRVPMGSIGRLFLNVRKAQKARMGRNPATGEEILIPAKPATTVPKVGFSAAFKDRTSRVPVTRIGGTVDNDTADGEIRDE